MEYIQVHDKRFKLYIPEADLQATVQHLAKEVSADLRDKNPIVMPILNGAFYFASDLLKEIDFDPEVSFVKMSSYVGTHSSGMVKELIGFPENVEGRHILLVEDIVESGISMKYTLDQLQKYNPASIRICTFFHKPHLFHMNFKLDYIGMNIADEFIVGYGLDYNGLGRTYKDVYILSDFTKE